MRNKKYPIIAIALVLLAVLTLSGCEELMSMFGMGGGGPGGPGGPGGTQNLNANQQLLMKLQNAKGKAMQEIMQYYQNNNKTLPTGFTKDPPDNTAKTVTHHFTNYTNSLGAILNGTETYTFASTPPASFEDQAQPTKVDIDITFTGTSFSPAQRLILSMTPPSGPGASMTATVCTVNGTDMKNDFNTMMQMPMGGGTGSPPQGFGPSTTPITLSSTALAADPNYATIENDLFAAINTERSTAGTPVAALTRVGNLDDLARRYAQAGQIDVGTALENRISTLAGVTNTGAAFLLYATMGSAFTATDIMNVYKSAQMNGETTMENAAYTKAGVGLYIGPNMGGAPDDVWKYAVVLFVKP